MRKFFLLCMTVIFVLCSAVSLFAMVPPPDPYHPYSLYAYNKLLQSEDVPEGFIYYQDISFLGDFVEFKFTQGKLNWNYYRYTLRTYEKEEGEIDGEYYAGTTFTIDVMQTSNSIPQLSIPKNNVLNSEDLKVYYSGGVGTNSIQGWDIGTYGDPVGLELSIQYEDDDLTTIQSKKSMIDLTISPTGKDWFSNFYAERKGSSVAYSPFGEFYQQWYFEDHRDEMVSTVVSSLLRRDYEKQYKEVFESYVDLVSGSQERFAINLNWFIYLGSLKSYQFDEESNFATGEFCFATPDPEIDIILTVKDWEPSENVSESSVTTEIPEGPDFRGQAFCRKYTNGEVVFGENEIVVTNSRNKKMMTLKTSPESALSNYPMYYDGGGFLSLLFSAESNEYCSQYLFSSFANVCENPYYEFPKTSSATTNSAVTNTDSTTDLPTDEGTVDVSTEPATLTDAVSTDGTADTSSTGANASDAPLTDGVDALPTDDIDTSSTASDTSTDPAPFPWLWVIVPAGIVLIAAATTALAIRKKKKSK